MEVELSFFWIHDDGTEEQAYHTSPLFFGSFFHKPLSFQIVPERDADPSRNCVVHKTLGSVSYPPLASCLGTLQLGCSFGTHFHASASLPVSFLSSFLPCFFLTVVIYQYSTCRLFAGPLYVSETLLCDQHASKIYP